MNITQPSTDIEGQPKQPKRRSRRVLRAVQAGSWILTLIFLLSLAWAVYQAVLKGNPMPLWAWLGLGVLFAVAIGFVVAAAVYRGVVEKAGPFDFRPSSHVAGNLRSETQRIEIGGASSLRADIKIVEGVLKLSGGAELAMDGSFTYDGADWKSPLVQYAINPSGLGYLEVEQRATHRPAMRQGPCEWVIRLADQLPTDLRVKFGAGEAELQLCGLNLSGLQVESGVGTLVVDLRGEWQSSMEAFIKAGIGDTVLRLPQSAGVSIHTDVRLGSTQAQGLNWNGDFYVNAAYGQAPVTLDIRVESGMGKLTLE